MSEPHTPAFRIASGDNNWLTVLGTLTGIAALAGIILVSSNWDAADPDHTPSAALLGVGLLGGALTMLTGALVAGAICWQLRRMGDGQQK